MGFHPGKPKASSLIVSGQTPFALLTPKHLPARERLARPINDITFLGQCDSTTVTALDFETKGNDPCIPGTHVVGIGLANIHGSVYFTQEHYATVMLALAKQQVPLIAHNLFFDASWPMRDFSSGLLTERSEVTTEQRQLQLNWLGCTYAAYKLLATEGWSGQEWGLKSAQRDLLLWASTNEKDLDAWLVDNGYFTSTSTTPKDGYVQQGNRYCKPDKGEMWQAPVAILGKYCRLDAESTWLLYEHIFLPALRRFSALSEYLAPERYTAYILSHVKQKLRGAAVDRDGLTAYQTELSSAISAAKDAFLSHPSIQEAMAVYDAAQVDALLQKEPKKHRKNGELSKNWQRWEEKLAGARSTRHFNLNSGQQRQWLFYDYLGYPVRKHTDSGQPAVDGDALLGFGEVGQLLIKQNDLVKELGFVEQMLDVSRHDGYVHGNARLPGTLTGRIAANTPNYSQLPKSRRFLSLFRARPGYKLVELDFSAIEQVVLTELSKDKALWKLYGPGAKSNDVYLYSGANLPVIGPTIRAAGYDPDNPTKEGIAAAKKAAKRERGIAKTVVLASSYGAGASKIATTLRLSGVDISDWEAEQIHKGYWDLYAGVKEYQRFLQREYRDRGGWVLNGLGRPLGVFHDYEKDLVNRVCQSTAHDCLMLYTGIVAERLNEAGVEWYPWILDFHDETVLEVREDQASQAAAILEGPALADLNRLLNGAIPIKGSAVVADNLAEIKCED